MKRTLPLLLFFALTACQGEPLPISSGAKIEGITWFGVPVHSLTEAERFFSHSLEMSFVDRGRGYSRFTLPSGQDVVLTTPLFADEGGFPEDRKTYMEHIFAFKVADIVKARRIYESRHIQFENAIHDAGEDSGRWAYFRDPHKVLFEIFEPPVPRAALRVSEKDIHIVKISSITIVPTETLPPEDVRQFYADALGLALHPSGNASSAQKGAQSFVAAGGSPASVLIRVRAAAPRALQNQIIIGFALQGSLAAARTIFQQRGIEVLPLERDRQERDPPISGFLIRGPEGMLFRIEKAS